MSVNNVKFVKVDQYFNIDLVKHFISDDEYIIEDPCCIHKVKNKVFHSLDGPAIISKNRIKKYEIIKNSRFDNEFEFKKGPYYDDDKDIIIEIEKIEKINIDNNENEREEWWVDGKLHRDDGPAFIEIDNRVIYYGNNNREDKNTYSWYKNGLKHRIDAPALINGNLKVWYKNGKHHRLNGPAVEMYDGTKKWYIDGELHRENGPAIVTNNGNKEWWFKGKRHRDGKPAIERSGGSKEWWFEGVLHRDNGPAVELRDGTKEWYKNGVPHRVGKPAIVYNHGSEDWYYEGMRHRLEGPSYKYRENSKFNAYHIYDKKLTREEHEKISKFIIKREKKLSIKYARIWYQLCDKPGNIIYENNLNKSLTGIEELYKNKKNENN